MDLDSIYIRHCLLYEYRQGWNVTEAAERFLPYISNQLGRIGWRFVIGSTNGGRPSVVNNDSLNDFIACDPK